MLESLWLQLVDVSREMLWLSVFFILLAALVKRRRALVDGLRAAGEIRLNLVYVIADIIAVAPLLVLAVAALNDAVESLNLALFSKQAYQALPAPAVLLLAVLASDFVGYWRHRLMHTAALWPAHAIHHSDREMTWLALARLHPVNRLITTILNAGALALLGMPAWAIALNAVIRHHYGYFIHADLPWTYGKLRYVLVSPVMHRWHHVRDLELSGKNFATVFSFYDVAFGTFHHPDHRPSALGIEEPDFPNRWLGQTLYPFRVWLKA